MRSPPGKSDVNGLLPSSQVLRVRLREDAKCAPTSGFLGCPVLQRTCESVCVQGDVLFVTGANQADTVQEVSSCHMPRHALRHRPCLVRFPPPGPRCRGFALRCRAASAHTLLPRAAEPFFFASAGLSLPACAPLRGGVLLLSQLRGGPAGGDAARDARAAASEPCRAGGNFFFGFALGTAAWPELPRAGLAPSAQPAFRPRPLRTGEAAGLKLLWSWFAGSSRRPWWRTRSSILLRVFLLG